MADKRITDVDFIESLDGSESFFINQNSALKQIKKGNVLKDTVFDIKNGGTGATDATTARMNLNAQKKHNSEIVTLSSNGWSNYRQTISASSVTADNMVFVSPVSTDYTTYTEYGIYCSEQSLGILTFICDSVPSVNVNVNVATFD